jgi:hypothetical protein
MPVRIIGITVRIIGIPVRRSGIPVRTDNRNTGTDNRNTSTDNRNKDSLRGLGWVGYSREAQVGGRERGLVARLVAERRVARRVHVVHLRMII